MSPVNIENLTVIVVTYNEENNIKDCIDSAKRITNKILVVDSFSTDETVKIVRSNDVELLSYEYISYADKRNWAQNNNPYETEWVFHMDADERISDEMFVWFKDDFDWISKKYDGVMFTRKSIFMGKFLKYGGMYPTYTARLFNTSTGHCEDKAYDQHFVVDGTVRVEKLDILNDITPSLGKFIDTHNLYSNYEASEIALNLSHKGAVKKRLFKGNPVERRRWLKSNIYYSAPLFMRPFFYFIYRYFIRLGFLDGKEGFIFYVLQSFWFRFLVDSKVYEMRKRSNNDLDKLKNIVRIEYGVKL